MITHKKILDKAQKEIERLVEEKDKWYRHFYSMKLYAKSLEDQINKLTNPKPKTTMENMMSDSKAAMMRYTEKLRKEGLKYAKQKQSKRK